MVRFNKKKIRKIGAPVLAGALALSTAFYFVPNISANQVNAATDSEQTLNNDYPELLKNSGAGSDADKSETVYAVLNPDGSKKEVTVSEWLKNDSTGKLADYSVLKDIENTSGDEKYKKKGNNLSWGADGDDIYYSGKYDGELPVSVKVHYFLNGNEMSADEIAGKKGDVEIKFDYTVNDKVTKNGYTLDRPYAMVSAVVLDNDHFTNVSVDNGKAINDGNNTAVVGVALPGLQEDLDIGSGEMDIPESVTIKAHTTDFSIDGTYTVADSGFLQDTDTSKIDDTKDKVKELTDGLDELSDASEQLVSGAAKLDKATHTVATSTNKIKDGTKTLKSGSSQLSNGANDLAAGTGSLSVGAKNLAGGLNTLSVGTAKLAEGTSSLSAGADKLASGTSDLSSGADRVASGASSLSSGADEAKSGADQLNSGASTLNSQVGQLAQGTKSLDAGASQLNQGISSLSGQMSKAGQAASAINQNLQSVKKPTGYSKPDSSGIEDELNALIEAEKAAGNDDTVKKLEQTLKDVQNYDSEVKSTVDQANSDAASTYKSAATAQQYAAGLESSLTSDETKQQLEQLQQGSQQVADGAKQIDQGVNGVTDSEGNVTQKGLVQGLAELSAGTNTFASQLAKLQTGAKSLNDGASSLSTGAKSANDGAQSLSAGAKTVNSGAEEVNSGAKTAKSGADKLSSGAEEVNSGAKKVSSGAKTLDAGAGQLVTYMIKLADGTEQLAQGADTLSSGMNKFNKEGIQKFVSSVNDADIDSTLDRVEATMDAAKDGSFIGGKLSGTSGDSKIIFKTGEVKKDSDK